MHNGYHRIRQEARREHWLIVVINLSSNRIHWERVRGCRMSRINHKKEARRYLFECKRLWETTIDGERRNEWQIYNEQERVWGEADRNGVLLRVIIKTLTLEAASWVASDVCWRVRLCLEEPQYMQSLSASAYNMYTYLKQTWTFNRPILDLTSVFSAVLHRNMHIYRCLIRRSAFKHHRMKNGRGMAALHQLAWMAAIQVNEK